MLEILKQRKTLGLALCLTTLAAASTLQARGQRRASPEQCFQALDSDSNGSVTLQEVEANILARFAERTKRQEERKARWECRMMEKGLSEEDLAKRQEARQPRLGRGHGRGHGRQGPGRPGACPMNAPGATPDTGTAEPPAGEG